MLTNLELKLLVQIIRIGFKLKLFPFCIRFQTPNCSKNRIVEYGIRRKIFSTYIFTLNFINFLDHFYSVRTHFVLQEYTLMIFYSVLCGCNLCFTCNVWTRLKFQNQIVNLLNLIVNINREAKKGCPVNDNDNIENQKLLKYRSWFFYCFVNYLYFASFAVGITSAGIISFHFISNIQFINEFSLPWKLLILVICFLSYFIYFVNGCLSGILLIYTMCLSCTLIKSIILKCHSNW